MPKLRSVKLMFVVCPRKYDGIRRQIVNLPKFRPPLFPDPKAIVLYYYYFFYRHLMFFLFNKLDLIEVLIARQSIQFLHCEINYPIYFVCEGERNRKRVTKFFLSTADNQHDLSIVIYCLSEKKKIHCKYIAYIVLY